MLGGDKELIRLAGLMKKVVLEFRQRGFPDLKGSIGFRKEVCHFQNRLRCFEREHDADTRVIISSFSKCQDIATRSESHLVWFVMAGVGVYYASGIWQLLCSGYMFEPGLRSFGYLVRLYLFSWMEMHRVYFDSGWMR